jgi:hypothetical protein
MITYTKPHPPVGFLAISDISQTCFNPRILDPPEIITQTYLDPYPHNNETVVKPSKCEASQHAPSEKLELELQLQPFLSDASLRCSM